MVPVLHVLLTILKILGIAILVILGIVLVLLVLVLFVPIRYRSKGVFEGKNIDVGADVTWLFCLVHLRIAYKSSKPMHNKLKILGIPFYDNLREKKPPKEKKVKKTDKKEEQNTVKIVETEPKVLAQSDENKKEEYTACEAPDKKEGIFGKISGVFENIKFTFEKICDTIRNIKDNIRFYIKLLNLESTKAAFELCKVQLFKLLKLISPRKCRIRLHIGFDDPSTMGEVLAVYGVLYPWHMGKVEIRPEFETAVMEGDYNIKGRIRIVSIVKAACIIYFDKNVKLFIKHLKRSNTNNRED